MATTYDALTADVRTRAWTRAVSPKGKRLHRRSVRHAARMTLADWMIYE